MPVPLSSAQPPRPLLRERVFDTLRAAIVDGTLEPGERLVDADLCAWLGVSRTPVRIRPGSSTVVTPLDPRAAAEAQAVAASMHELAARTAVPLLTESHCAVMNAANRAFETALATTNVDAAIAADDAFHGVFVEVAGNRRVAAILGDVTPLLRRMERVRFASLVGRGSVAQHQRIVELAQRGDAEGAAAEVRANWLTLKP